MLKISKIVDCPTFLEVLAYINYFPSAVVGPSFEFRDFYDFIYMKKEFSNIPIMKAFKAGGIELLKSVACIASMMALSNTFDYRYCASKEFTQLSFINRVIYPFNHF